MLAKAIGIILVSMVILTSLIFCIILIQEGIAEEMLQSNLDVANKILVNNTQKLQIQERKDNYDNVKLDYDAVFLVGILILNITAIFLALNAQKISKLSFTGFLFLGSIFLIFFYPIIAYINTYLYKNLILSIFTSTTLIMPLYAYFMTSQYIFVFLDIFLLLLLNIVFGREPNDNVVTGGFD